MTHLSPRIRRAALLAGAPLLLATASCEPSDYVPCGQGTEIPLAPAWHVFKAELAQGQICSWPLVMNGAPTQSTATLAQLTLVEGKATLKLDSHLEAEPGWIPTHAYAPGGHVIQVQALEAGTVMLTFKILGPEGPVSTGLSINLADPRLTEDPTIGQMANLMATVAGDSHGGLLLAQWLEAFGDATVGARTGPVDLLGYLQSTYGSDPRSWNMSQLPFTTASIQNRIDLMDASSCGEIRVVVVVAVAPYDNMGFLFRFRQPAANLDRSPGGVVYCDNLAWRWASLRTLSGEQWFIKANELLQDALLRPSFIAAQTSEAIGTGGSWEFREWVPVPNPDPATQAQLPKIMATHPLPMTVDTPRLNPAGADRDAFLAFVEANAAGLDGRTVAIPEADLARTAQATEGTWTPLDLTGVSPATLSAYPDLRKQIEVAGCTGCHVTASGMRHSRPSNNTSNFMKAELAGRAAFLGALQRGERPARGFDPLASTLLPP